MILSVIIFTIAFIRRFKEGEMKLVWNLLLQSIFPGGKMAHIDLPAAIPEKQAQSARPLYQDPAVTPPPHPHQPAQRDTRSFGRVPSARTQTPVTRTDTLRVPSARTRTSTLGATLTFTPVGTATQPWVGTNTPTPTITYTPSNTPTASKTPTATRTGSRTPTPTNTGTFTATYTPSRTNTPIPTQTMTQVVPTGQTWTFYIYAGSERIALESSWTPGSSTLTFLFSDHQPLPLRSKGAMQARPAWQ
jgi:hypothetical protein